jgi:glycosyltransferase involved in cell wall biosynthesis
MKFVMVHNRYQQAGGEDQVFEAEATLLESHGHEVVRLTEHNDRVGELGQLELAHATIWNGGTYHAVRAMLRREQPQVLHCHNTFPLVSPAIYYAARAEGVPVVQTLHNYRLVCPNALLFRDGHLCEDCLVARSPIAGIVHACYRDSRVATGVVAAMLTVHRALGTWARLIDVFIALSEFARHKYIQGGLPEEKIVVKPNFIHPDPGERDTNGSGALFVGRLTPEKGVHTLIAAWEQLGAAIPLTIVGSGPLAGAVEDAARRIAGVTWLGSQPRERVLTLMKRAGFLIIPSLWYEAFGVVIAEAYGVGLPVIASNLGSMSVLIRDRRTGLHFRPGDVEDLVAHVRWAIAHPAEMRAIGKRARLEYETRYTADRNYGLLCQAYQMAIDRATRRHARRAHARAR